METLETLDTVRTLQRKLYLKAKREPKFRFYALYDKVYRPDVLDKAYASVKASKGGPGIDGVSFSMIEQEVGQSQFLAELAKDLKAGNYKANPVMRVMIPKSNGEMRPLGIPTIRDRVAQMAVKLVIEPIFESDFVEHSYGFRPKRSAHDAINTITRALLAGYTQVIDADLSKYFDTIPHAKLMKVVAERISDKSILRLIKMWLKAPIIEVDQRGKRRVVGGGKNSRFGTPQGGVISPLLANLYLHILDRVWERNNLATKLKARIVRFADDFVVLCKEDVNRPLSLIKKVLDRLDLKLNTDKTQVVNTWDEALVFLGFELQMRKSWKSGKYYPHVQPADKSVKKIKQAVKEVTGRTYTSIPMDDIIMLVNRRLRGWSNYFHFRNSSRRLSCVKNFVETRVILHLRRRHKLRRYYQGFRTFPRERLYNEYGLYKVPTTAKWV